MFSTKKEKSKNRILFIEKEIINFFQDNPSTLATAEHLAICLCRNLQQIKEGLTSLEKKKKIKTSSIEDKKIYYV